MGDGVMWWCYTGSFSIGLYSKHNLLANLKLIDSSKLFPKFPRNECTTIFVLYPHSKLETLCGVNMCRKSHIFISAHLILIKEMNSGVAWDDLKKYDSIT